MDAVLPRLTSEQAAARLGVRPQTLYAYVSRGLLSRERGPHGSTFDALEIEQFASSRRRTGPVRGAAAPGGSGSPLMVLDTDIALIDDGELLLRGLPASELATAYPYESVARWLWGQAAGASGAAQDAGEPGAAREPAPDAVAAPFSADPDAVAAARVAVQALGPDATALDRVQVAVPVLGAADPTRHDLCPDAVRATAERLIGGVIAALASTAEGGPGLASRGNEPPSPKGVAGSVWQAFAGAPGDAAALRALNAALVLLVDHDLAVSTLAARAAASARATPYAVVSSGLGALDSALHGNASGAASELIRSVRDGTDARTALAQTVARTGRPAPGFGQPLYPGIDARAGILLPLVAELPGGPPVVDAVDHLAAEVAARTGRHPNVDLALAALTTAAGMQDDAGAAIFAIGRMAGWIAHALDEYTQRPLRLRPTGRYVGPPAARD